MLRVKVLASGSSGNSLLIDSSGSRLLVDAGLSARRLEQRLAEAEIEPKSLDGILITHEHGDHAKGLKIFCSRHEVPVFCNAATADVLGRNRVDDKIHWHIFQTGKDFQVGKLDISSFSVPHDATEPVGFTLSDGASTFGVLTDLGFATTAVRERVAELDGLLIEANHDTSMLQNDPKRPWSVKQRIVSRHGHLSNDAAAAVIAYCAERHLKHAILGHLSRDCNRADLAAAAVAEKLDGGKLELAVVKCDDDILEIELGGSSGKPGPACVMETPLLSGWRE